MCGVAGLLTTVRGPIALDTVVDQMTVSIAHRGPDGSGRWIDQEAGVALGHRRLAVLDLSEAGAQPMSSPSGRYVITYNGEIYNFAEIRTRLEQSGPAVVWRGHSDTEILVAAIERWGFQETLPLLEGMFAIGVWDRQTRRLLLARDRFGEKPLYYGVRDKTFYFCSELRAIQSQMKLGDSDVDVESLNALLTRSYIPAPRTIFRGVFKLPAASTLEVGPDAIDSGRLPTPEPYWAATEAASRASSTPFAGDDRELVDHLQSLLERSIGLRLVADVPVGSMLSGGIDSTCISAVAQSLSTRRLKTFTIGFEDAAYDESQEAASVASALGTDHTTVMLRQGDFVDAVQRMSEIYDEPFADSSQVPTYLVSHALRRHVTVALSGDAGDELFGGYHRHRVAPRLWRRLSSVPLPLRRLAAAGLALDSQELAPRALAYASGARGEGADRIRKASRMIDARSPEDLYARLTRNGGEQSDLILAPPAGSGLAQQARPVAGDFDVTRRMMLGDTMDYLPNDILTKVDRASMSVALETRPPFLDTALFEFAWSLPTDRLIDANAGKLPLRALAKRYVPAALVERPKRGFAMPLADLLRTSLRPWADDLLSSDSLSSTGVYAVDRTARMWQAHRSGQADHSARLWPVLMFESWRRTL